MFRNYCGYSASSDTIVNKITEVQAELEKGRVEADFDRPQAQMTLQQIGNALQSTVVNMHQKQSDIETKMTEKNAQFETLKTHLYDLKGSMPSEEFDLAETAWFVNKTNAISTFITKDNELLKIFNGHPSKINSSIQCVSFINSLSYNDLKRAS